MDAKLTLEKAKWELRQKVAVKGHQQQLKSEPGHRPETLEALALARKPERHKDGRGKGRIVFAKTSHKGGPKASNQQNHCTRKTLTLSWCQVSS